MVSGFSAREAPPHPSKVSAAPTLKTPFRKTAFFVFAMLLAQNGSANLVQNGDFTGLTYSGPALPAGQTALFGQIGGTTGAASGAVLVANSWATGGYNFVYSAATVDSGTQASGANAGQPVEVPGEATVGTWGNTYMWGKNNGGPSTWSAPPGGGNFVAADGAYEQGAITQTITGLTVGKTYVLKFWYGAAQQQGTYTQATTDQWTVSMGTGNVAGNFKTPTINLAAESFSGWTQATFYFYAGSTTETLSFLAAGTPNGQPPFALLANVDLEIVPDISNWMIFAGFGALCISLEILRRRRRRRLELLPAV